MKTSLRTGAHVAVFRRPPKGASASTEKLSIVFPVFNEARYVEQVIEAILAKQLRIKKELVIVESNSTDGTREIVQKFEGRPGVTIVLEDKPQGKGHAVKTGLKAVSGSIVLIQDADFEYDIEDYDALLEPILQHRAAFVLGSRTLGLDDWKVRRFEGSAAKRVMLNAAQVAFAHTFNVLYQQRITDVNTMFKVFRAECLEGLDLESDGFNLDIELACKLVKNGNAPIEVPVNYVARGFEEGKKISFIRDALPSYAAFFKYRFK
jgi:glycosyltransferase involved in cell wall biosynthesis